MRTGRAAWVACGLAVVVATVLLLVPLPREWLGGWRSLLLDLGHVPLFAALTLILGRALGGPWYRPVLPALTLAALVEFAQHFVGRSGSLADFLRGAAGVLAAAILLRAMRPRSWRRLVGHGLAAVAFVAVAVADAMPALLDAAEGWGDFPTLADFSTQRQLQRWTCRQAGLTRVPSPGQPGAFAGRLELRPGPADYPGATLAHVRRDFRGHRRLCWSFVVEGGPLGLVFSLRGPTAQGGSSHYQLGRVFEAGEHTVTMDLAEAAERGEEGPLDLGALWWSQVFVERPRERRMVYLRRVWVE